MNEYTHLVLVKGRYQIVALMPAPGHDPVGIAGYALTTLAGATLWRDLTLDDARTRLELLLADDALAAPSASHARSIRSGR